MCIMESAQQIKQINHRAKFLTSQIKEMSLANGTL